MLGLGLKPAEQDAPGLAELLGIKAGLGHLWSGITRKGVAVKTGINQFPKVQHCCVGAAHHPHLRTILTAPCRKGAQ